MSRRRSLACLVLTSSLVLGLAGVAAGPVAAEPADTVDPYGGDVNVGVGTREEICQPERPGRVRLMAFLEQQWPQVTTGGYACREIDDVTPPINPECNGEWNPPFSSCWSMHAAGRAIDVMVGGGLNSPTPEGVALGDEIVTWLLAHRDGHDNYYARVMGIQQILWNRRCWESHRSADHTVVAAGDMRRCGIRNHDNHPHLTLSQAGAMGQTSWYVPPPAPTPTPDPLPLPQAAAPPATPADWSGPGVPVVPPGPGRTP